MFRLIFSFVIMVSMIAACQTKAPSEEEVRSKIVGSYCNDTYSLHITNETYTCTKFTPAILGKIPIPESCSGNYSLSLEDGSWIFRFERDPDPKGVNHCEFSYPIWEGDKGYLIGEEILKLREPFDNSEITVGGCDL